MLIVLAVRNVWRNKKRSFLTVLALAIGLLSASFLGALQEGSRRQIEEDAVFNLLPHSTIASESYFDERLAIHSVDRLNNEEESLLFKNFGVLGVAERVRVQAIVMSERESVSLQFLGISPEEEEGYSVLGHDPSTLSSAFIQSEDEDGIILGESMLVDLKTQIGKRIVLIAQDSQGRSVERGFLIKGTYKSDLTSIEKSYAVTGRKTAQEFLVLGDRVSEQGLYFSSPELSVEYSPEIESYLSGRKVRNWKEVEPFLQAVVKLQSGVLWLWYAVVLFSVFFGVLNTLFMSIFEREREFCLYQAIGMKSGFIVIQIVFETAVLLLIGLFFGALLSCSVIFTLSKLGIPLGAFSQGVQMLGMRDVVYPFLSISSMFVFMFIIFGVCIIGSIIPAYRASRLSPLRLLTR